MKPAAAVLVALVLAPLVLGATPLHAAEPVRSVPALDVSRYLGTWYEIASYPFFFQRGCVATEARYAAGEDGELLVHNVCRKDTLDGDVKDARGRAWVPDPAAPGQLKVSFFGPFAGDYWVLELGADYEYAVVGDPGRDTLWILSRTRRMDPAVYQGIVGRLTAAGWDVSRLRLTLQPAG